jgi:acetyl esterase/lipase
LAPEHPDPAAPEDCFNIYQGLLARCIAPGKLADSGDSAGATWVLSTLLRARDSGTPLPAAAAVLSPWVDLSMRNETYDTVTDPTAPRGR